MYKNHRATSGKCKTEIDGFDPTILEPSFQRQEEIKFSVIRSKLAIGEAQLDEGKFIDGEEFIRGLIFKRGC